MGENCRINGGVVVGNKDSQANIAVIGNNVRLSIGCKIIGKIFIGDNAIVAPNSVVIKDVPSGAVVSGVPAIIIKKMDKQILWITYLKAIYVIFVFLLVLCSSMSLFHH